MNSSKSWGLQIDNSVYKFLARIPRHDAEHIISSIEKLPLDPFRGDIQKMRGETNIWRKRIGAYRIRYELISQEKIIHVFLVQRRNSKSY